MREIILHIPHSSLDIPKEYLRDYTIDNSSLESYNIEMSDMFTDQIFENKKFHTVRFNYSRLFCDVEKYLDPKLEPMSKYGMGPIYTHIYDGTRIRNISSERRNLIIDKYYNGHHERLDNLTKDLVDAGRNVLVIDCHSFSDMLASYLFGNGVYPDICVGYDEDYADENAIRIILEEFRKFGYTIEFNYPFRGALVPNLAFTDEHYKRNVKGVMIEINRKTYLNKGNELDDIKFAKMKQIIKSIYDRIDESVHF